MLSPGVKKRLRRGEKFISHVAAMNLFYKWGGGRRWNPTRTILSPEGGDCSWGALEVLKAMGVGVSDRAGSTWSLAEEGAEGKGENFTLFIKNPVGDEHVIMRLRRRHTLGGLLPKHRWAEVGGSDNPKSKGGMAWFIPGKSMGMTVKQRVAEFPIHRHFPELEGRSTESPTNG
jgi:hypothetical protein